MGQTAADEGQTEDWGDGVADGDQKERAVVVASFPELGGRALQQQSRYVLIDICASTLKSQKGLKDNSRIGSIRGIASPVDCKNVQNSAVIGIAAPAPTSSVYHGESPPKKEGSPA